MNLQDEYNEEYENQIINEEYKVWKKNAPYLYDLVITHVLEWPSLTCQWLPSKDSPPDSDYTIHKLILGTHTSDQEPNYLMIAKVRLPNEEALTDVTNYGNPGKDDGGSNLPSGDQKVTIETKILHEGEVNRARYMPQKYNIIASKAISGEVLIFDYTQHPTTPINNEIIRPELRLTGHSKEGYGLSWSPHKTGYLLSGANDNKICLWNIEGSTVSDKVMKPFLEFNFHKSSVQDVAWHNFSTDTFASCGDDKKIILWDLRKPLMPTIAIDAHSQEVNTLDFNHTDEYLFISGSSDKNVALWDLRNPSRSLHAFEGHTDDVIKVEWAPNNNTIFGSCSSDRRIRIWDMSKIGQEVKAEDACDGPPELLFIHGGHRARVPDFSWNWNEMLLIGSVEEENNILQIWQMASNIYQEDDNDDEMRNEMITEKQYRQIN